jgi:hypothetical protein
VDLRKPEIGAQFVSFNFQNPLIWVVGSRLARIVSAQMLGYARLGAFDWVAALVHALS